jgi:hypothetical protein
MKLIFSLSTCDLNKTYCFYSSLGATWLLGEDISPPGARPAKPNEQGLPEMMAVLGGIELNFYFHDTKSRCSDENTLIEIHFETQDEVTNARNHLVNKGVFIPLKGGKGCDSDVIADPDGRRIALYGPTLFGV